MSHVILLLGLDARSDLVRTYPKCCSLLLQLRYVEFRPIILSPVCFKIRHLGCRLFKENLQQAVQILPVAFCVFFVRELKTFKTCQKIIRPIRDKISKNVRYS